VGQKRGYQRGFPVAVLVGLEDNQAVLWQVFSQVVKPFQRLKLEGNRTESNAVYNFHESILNSLKPLLHEGVKSIVVTAPPRTTYTKDFLEHTQKHHRYLTQSKNPDRANFAELVGSADDQLKVAELVKTKEFTKLVEDTTSQEADHILNSLEKHLYGDDSVVLYALKEIEDTIYMRDNGVQPTHNEYLLLTSKYLGESKQKNRIHRLIQIAKNKKVKTKVIDTETSAGNRITQFGGIVFFSTPTNF
jgi:stalled ribosome rescue protein Dom34